VRTSLRERFGINYDKTLQEITPDHAGQGRWAAQRAEDKKFEQTKKDILEYLDTEKGLPAEAGEWHRLVYLWNDAKDSVSARKQLERQLAAAEARCVWLHQLFVCVCVLLLLCLLYTRR